MKILLIAAQTFKEIFKSKILVNVLFLGLFLLIVTVVASEFSYGVAPKVALDVGLGCLSLSLIGISIFLGASLINNEIENRTLYMVISRPVGRMEFLFGKILGLVGILAVNTICLSLFVLFSYVNLDGQWHYLIPWTIFFSFLESVIVLLVVILFSLLSGTIITVMMGICIFFAGHGIEGVKETMLYKLNGTVRTFIDIYSVLMPNLGKLNIKPFVLYDDLISSSYLFNSFLYSLLWFGILSVFSILIIRKKEFS